MTGKAVALIVAAVVAVAAVTVVLAVALGGSDTHPATHAMPNGQQMKGGSMESMHTMPDGSSMGGMHMGN